jgi:hypothetical protein
MVKIKQNQKIRVISGKTSFYTTAKQIRSFEGVGAFSAFNDTLQQALFTLENSNACSVGISGAWNEIPVQIDLV